MVQAHLQSSIKRNFETVADNGHDLKAFYILILPLEVDDSFGITKVFE